MRRDTCHYTPTGWVFRAVVPRGIRRPGGWPPRQTQFRKRVNLERLNRGLASWVDDYTHNHGQDRRINSPILGRPRDLHVYLPPDIRPAWPTR